MSFRGKIQGINGVPLASAAAFGIHEIIVHGAKAHVCRQRLDFRVAAIEIGDFLQSFLPGRGREIEFDEWAVGFQRGGAGEIIERLVGTVLAENSLFICQGFIGDFVGAIRGEPQFAAQGDRVVVARSKSDHAGAGAVVTVLFVITDADNDAQAAAVDPLVLTQSAEGSLGGVLVQVGEAIFDVIGRGDIVHFELGFVAVQLFAQGF